MKKPGSAAIALAKARRLARFVHKTGCEHVTVMVVPHSTRPTINMRFSWYLIFALCGLLAVLFSVNLVLLLDRSVSRQGYDSLRDRYQDLSRERRSIEKKFRVLAHRIESLKPLFPKLLFYSDRDTARFYNIWGQGGSDPSSLAVSRSNLPALEEMDLKVKNLQRDIDIMKSVLDKANTYLSENKEVFHKLPHLWPLPDGGYITSEYGWREHPILKHRVEFHKGLDIADYPGAPIISTADGTVVSTGYDPSLGNFVRVLHAYGFMTIYGHCQRLKSYPGQHVRQGQVIAFVGRTGRTTGFHLHYEIRLGMEALDPMPYLMQSK